MSDMQMRLRQEYAIDDGYSLDGEEILYELENGRHVLSELRLEQEE